jgi:hypothetical protein
MQALLNCLLSKPIMIGENGKKLPKSKRNNAIGISNTVK